MAIPENVRLLHGPYKAPALSRGDRAVCLVRETAVVITSWTDARIPWPRCRAFASTCGGTGLLVDEELARAIRQESAAAVSYWWGVSPAVLAQWRRALAVTRTNNPGSHRLVKINARLGAAKQRAKACSDKEGRRRKLK